MASSSRRGAVAIGPVLALSLTACAAPGLYMVASGRDKGMAPGPTTEFELEDDGRDGCRKKAAPDALFAQGGQTVTWRITNNCKQAAVVRVDDFNEKGNPFKGPDPFPTRPAPATVAPGKEGQLTGTVRPEVPDKHKGFHVYRYRIKIRAGGHENTDDPEIIIEWPY